MVEGGHGILEQDLLREVEDARNDHLNNEIGDFIAQY